MTSSEPANPSPQRRSWRRWGWLAALLLVLGGGWGLWQWRKQAKGPIRILLLPPLAHGGLQGEEALILGAYFRHYLDHLGGYAVTPGSVLVSQGALNRKGGPVHVLQLSVRRKGVLLDLGCRHTLSAAGRFEDPPEEPRFTGLRAPAEAFHACFRQLGLPHSSGPIPYLLPRQPEAFWGLVEAHAQAQAQAQGVTEELLAKVRALSAAEPGCIQAKVVLGRLHMERAYAHKDRAGQDATAALGVLESLVPEGLQHPEVVANLAGLHVEMGDPLKGLNLVHRALRQRPDSPRVLTAANYLLRTAGLLEPALLASARAAKVSALEDFGIPGDMALLWSGRLEAYDKSLKESLWNARSTLAGFLEGHLSLLRGRRLKAEAQFEASRRLEKGAEFYPEIHHLVDIFLAVLRNQPGEAIRRLETLEALRRASHLPGPEVTLHMAEAYALLGQVERAMDLVQASLAEGLACGEWYQRNELLGPVRKSPRWPAFLQKVAERQRLAELQLPLASWQFLED